MPFAEANGHRLFWEERGDGEPLVLVIGLGADHLAWALQVDAWAEHFRTITFDNRDAGQSDYVEEGYGIEDMARDTIALADAIGLDAFHLLGLSMGGTIAQEVALAEPDRVRSLTLCLTWASGGRWSVEWARLEANDHMRTPREEVVDKMLLRCLSEETFEDQGAIDYLRAMSLDNPHPQSPEAFRRQVQACGRHDALDRMGDIRAPTHVIGAARDLVVPPWKAEEIAERIPDAELTMIADGTHGVNLERPEEFNAIVLDWLRAQAGERSAA